MGGGVGAAAVVSLDTASSLLPSAPRPKGDKFFSHAAALVTAASSVGGAGGEAAEVGAAVG